MARVRMTLEYDYEGDEKNNVTAAQSEKDYWTSGAVSVEDILTGCTDATLKIDIIGDVADDDEVEETADADED